MIALVASAGTIAFVYYGALIETDFASARALREMPRVFLQDVLLFAIFGVFTLFSPGGRDFGGGGDGAGRGSGARRSNYASALVDPVEFARVLGTQQVEVKADGFDTPLGSLASVVALDAKGRTLARFWIHVYQQRAAEQHWARAITSAQPVAGPGESAVSSGDRFNFKRGDTVVELRVTKGQGGLPAPALATLAAAVDRRLRQ